MQKSLIPAALLALLLTACGGESQTPAAASSQPAAASTASEAPVETTASAEADTPAPASEAAAASSSASAATGMNSPVCKEALADQKKFVESAENKAEEQKHLDEWLAQMKEATPQEQEESCKATLEANKEDAKDAKDE